MVKRLRLGIKHDNTFIVQKIALRLWLLDYFKNPRVLDIYGGNGAMFRQVWKTQNYTLGEGDALKWLAAHDLDYDIYDIDTWGSPWEALAIINNKCQKGRIGIICTDGAVKRAGQVRGTIPNIVLKALDWDGKDRRLKAEIYYHYSVACRQIIKAIMSNYNIERLAIKEHGKCGYCSTVYFAAILKKEINL